MDPYNGNIPHFDIQTLEAMYVVTLRASFREGGKRAMKLSREIPVEEACS
jgi:hypothetical protein